MKKLVITLTGDNDDESFREMFKYSHPRMQKYADKVGAEFKVLVGKGNHSHLMYRKLDLKDYLNDYDRILYVDGDIIISENSSNIFDFVPQDSIGMYNEINSNLPKLVRDYINLYNEFLKKSFKCPISHDQYDYSKYFNAGVMVFSKGHEELFTSPLTEIHTHLLEQTWFNIIINLKKLKTFDIGLQFNNTHWLENKKSQFYHLTASKNKAFELIRFLTMRGMDTSFIGDYEHRKENVTSNWRFQRGNKPRL